MNYILDIETVQTAGAGVKPRSDVDAVLEKNGWKRKNLYDLAKKAPFRQLQMLAVLLWMQFCLKKTDVVFIQWKITLLKPFSSFAFEKAGSCRKIMFIHDIDSLRREEPVFCEKERFNRCDAVVAHTKAMKEWLEEHGVSRKIFVLGIFDYLTEYMPDYKQRVHRQTGKAYEVVFAGNLSRQKSGFLYQPFKPVHYSLVLYGPDYAGDTGCGKIYKGVLKPDEMAGGIQGDFGLVWDGSSLDGCSGAYGRYLRYNCPHKMAMYLACGLPVIVWSGSAMAGFVRENQIGICADSVLEIDEMLAGLTAGDYDVLLECVREQQKKVAGGDYTAKMARDIGEYFSVPVNA